MTGSPPLCFNAPSSSSRRDADGKKRGHTCYRLHQILVQAPASVSAAVLLAGGCWAARRRREALLG
ncbi:hypothetical protein PIB30_042321, partial [Stylosanthes scabra]|nr:hypothetical protein [Stylosanthes scabra]